MTETKFHYYEPTFPTHPAVLRFQLPITEPGFSIVVPSNHTVLSVAPNRGDGYYIDVWIECRPSQTETAEIFQVFGTGHSLDLGRNLRRELEFVGTVVMPDELVWHVYREAK